MVRDKVCFVASQYNCRVLYSVRQHCKNKGREKSEIDLEKFPLTQRCVNGVHASFDVRLVCAPSSSLCASFRSRCAIRRRFVQKVSSSAKSKIWGAPPQFHNAISPMSLVALRGSSQYNFPVAGVLVFSLTINEYHRSFYCSLAKGRGVRWARFRGVTQHVLRKG